jgi:hypothetical protein
MDHITNSPKFRDDKSDLDLSGNNLVVGGSQQNNNLLENEKLLDNIDDIFDKINNHDNDEIRPNEGKKHFSMINIDHTKIFDNV